MAPADPNAAAAPTVETVASEVRVVVGRVRSPAGLAETDLPVLDALAGDRSQVPQLIAEAIERITSEQYREFLQLLLPFPFTPAAPWEQLGPNRRSDGRGERASRAAFGLSWDACNRPGQLLDGRSRRDWAERFLAEAILAGVAGEQVPEDAGAAEVASLQTVEPPDAAPSAAAAAPDAGPELGSEDAPEPDEVVADTSDDSSDVAPTDAVDHAGRRRRSPRLVGAAIMALVVVVAGLWYGVVRSDDPSGRTAGASGTTTSVVDEPAPDVEGETTVASDPISCAAVGSLNTIAAQEPNAQELSQDLIDLYRSLPEDVGCPTDPAFVWGELVVQELDSGEDDLPAGMLVEKTSGTGVYLTPTAYTRYRTLGSGDGSLAQDLGGLPGEVVTLEDGSQEVQLSKGVLFVAETEGAPFFWVPGDFLTLYRDTPWLGRPVGNPLPSLQQDYQHGYGEFDRGTGELHLTELDDPGAELPAIKDLAKKVVRQADNTAWWIGEDGKRYWIPSGAVWSCLVHGRDNEVQTLRAYAIASLPYGGHARCPKP